MEITLKLAADEINFLIQALGQLPTASGAYPLLLKIRKQTEKQIPELSSEQG